MKNYLILILSIAVIILAILLVTNPKITEKEFEYFYTELEIIIKMLNKLKLSVNC